MTSELRTDGQAFDLEFWVPHPCGLCKGGALFRVIFVLIH